MKRSAITVLCGLLLAAGLAANAAERRVVASEWPTRVELNLNETRSISRNGGEPHQFPTVVGGLRMLIENTRIWFESGTVAATAHAKDLSFTFTHVGEPWGPADVRFPIGSFRWHATTYHNTWMGLVPQNDQVYSLKVLPRSWVLNRL